jgi:hypothetical protein
MQHSIHIWTIPYAVGFSVGTVHPLCSNVRYQSAWNNLSQVHQYVVLRQSQKNNIYDFILLDSCPDTRDIQHSLRTLELTIDIATSGSSVVISIVFRRRPRFVAEHLHLHVSHPLFLLLLLSWAPRHLKDLNYVRCD